MVKDAGYDIVNVDCVVMCDAVMLGKRKTAMSATMAGHLGIDGGQINVSATTFEGRGAIGRSEIVACETVALLRKTT
jgi:2-C-methyl-D-erythritol 2,4-cyclodiphosphate synthase